jgi:hypothetical protein
MITDKVEVEHQNIHMIGPYDTIYDSYNPRAPDNTPANGERESSESSTAIAVALTALSDSNNGFHTRSSAKRAAESTVGSVPIKVEYRERIASPVGSRLPSASDIVQGRKENMTDSSHIEDSRFMSEGAIYHKIPPPFQPPNHGANKRQRMVTPAAAKVIDDEDEPRSSPSVRKVSGVSGKQEDFGERDDGNGVERRVLSEIIGNSIF